MSYNYFTKVLRLQCFRFELLEKMSKPQTRSQTSLHEWGNPADLPNSVIPTWADVYRFIRKCQNDLRPSQPHSATSPNPPNFRVYDVVEQRLASIWDKFSFPYGSPRMVKYRVEALHQKAVRLNSVPHERRDEKWLSEVKSWDLKMFDISGCSCFDSLINHHGLEELKDKRLKDAPTFTLLISEIRAKCKCKSKVPLSEWPEYCDQKLRLGMLGPVDTQATARLQVRLYRQQQRQQQAEAERERRLEEASPNASLSAIGAACLDALELDEPTQPGAGLQVQDLDPDDPDFIVPEFLRARIQKHRYNSFDLSNLAIECERFGVSNVAGAAVINGYLKDIGILSESNALCPQKLERQRESVRNKNVKQLSDKSQGLHALAFDGKRINGRIIAETVKKTKEGNVLTKHRGQKVREYVCVLTEPEHLYLDHFIPASGKSVDEAKELLALIALHDSKDTLKALCADGAPTNTGRLGGVIRRIELELGRPLQWVICMLHMSELPFRDLCDSVDGKSTGPNSGGGPIGREITGPSDKLLKKPIVPFEAVPGKVGLIPHEIEKDLSSEQQYFYQMIRSVQAGELVAPGLENREPGLLDNARWLTKANRILRLYVATVSPSPQLKRLVRAIVQFYGPSWFSFKSHWKMKDAARNFFYMVTLLQDMPQEDRAILQPAVLRNAFMAHPENILLSAITSSEESERQFGVNTILAARAKDRSRSEVRMFELPKSLNFQASTYLRLIPQQTWQALAFSSPPLLNDFSDEEIRLAERRPLKILDVPANTQAVERGVKLMTQAAHKYYGYDARHGFMVNTLIGRQNMPHFRWKGQYPV